MSEPYFTATVWVEVMYKCMVAFTKQQIYKMWLHYVHRVCPARCHQCLRAARWSTQRCHHCRTLTGTSQRSVGTSARAVRCAGPLPAWSPAEQCGACLDQCSVHSANPDHTTHSAIKHKQPLSLINHLSSHPKKSTLFISFINHSNNNQFTQNFYQM